MIFKTANILISVVYPVIASYNVLEYYTRLNQEHNFGRISVGGINVNLGEMFKSAMNENALPIGYTEKAVAQVSLQVQKWLIYWIVLSLLTLTETIVSFIIPFYQFFKLPLILYLLSPMLMNSSKLAVSAIVASDKPPTIDNVADWKQFQEQGCGFVYFKLIKPFLDGEVDAIMKYIPLDKLKHLTSTIPINLTTLSWALKIAMFKMSSNRSMDENIADSVSSRGVDSEVKSKSPVQQGAVGGVGGATASFYEEEFDMVDKPLETDSNLRLRDPKPKPENKRWLW